MMLVAAVAAVATACSANTPGDITLTGQRVLAAEVQRIRDIAATGTYPQLQSAVKRLKSLLATELRKGQVSSERATAIDDAADELLVDATPAATPTPSASSSPPSRSPTPSATPTQSATPSETASSTPTQSSTSSGTPSPGVTISVP
jgi:hypothetical protein